MKKYILDKLEEKDKEITRLKNEAIEIKASQIYNYHCSSIDIEKCSTDHLLASGVILELTFLGGKKAITPTLIKDGLSKETIIAIQKDLKRSFDLSTMFKPKNYEKFKKVI